MTDAIEGRWWLDFTRHPARDPSGNEFIFSAGKVTIAKTGEPAGTYEMEQDTLRVDLPLPSIDGEPPWRMVAYLLFLDPLSPSDELPGMLQTFDSEDRMFANHFCALVRRRADA